MTWSLANSRNDESAKIRWELVPYMRGRALDIGCGAYKVFPHFVGVDNGHHWGMQGVDVNAEASDLSLFASQSCDLVYSSHLLEHIEYEKVPDVLKEWARVAKQGGHIILYVPDEDEYPVVGHEYANQDHKWNCNYDKVVAAMEQVPRGWDLIDYQVRRETDEYSLFFVFRMKQGKGHDFSWKLPRPAKTCAVIRYGAIGDMTQMSSILPWLKSEGFFITLYCQSGHGYECIKHDPHIDRFIIQEKDAVPPVLLSEFWDATKKKYDKWINLCESVEGTLLAVPGRVNHEWPNELRAKYLNRNYLEWTHELAGVPPPYTPKFYATLDEKAWARRTAQRWGSRNILWSLAGSSGHKTWPHLDTVIANIMLEYDDVHVVLVGDELCRLLETGWEKEPRVHCQSGKWTIRESMAFSEAADLIIGTETGLLNATGFLDVPKIITLSHSSQEMLTKHWKNTIALEQPKGVGCPKQPCRQLHTTWDYCMKHESGTAVCQFEIGPEMMWDAIVSVLGVAKLKVAYG